MWDIVKASMKGNFVALNAYIGKRGKIIINFRGKVGVRG